MPRYDKYRQRDEIPVIDGDQGFIGVNMRLDPSQLQPTVMSEAINCRFVRGIAETRKGIGFPVWANKAVSVTGTATDGAVTNTAVFSTTGAVAHGYFSGQTVTINGFTDAAFNTSAVITVLTASTFSYTITGGPGGDAGGTGTAVGQGTLPWGTIYGIGEFKDPNTAKEYVIVATDTGVYYTSPYNVPVLIPLPAGVTLDAEVNFTQAFDRLLMHRGDTKTTLELRDITASWTEVSQTPIPTNKSGFGTQAIPQSKRSLFFQNRLFIPFRNDEIAVSDFNDYTRYLPVFQEFKVNQGSADSLVNIEKFSNTAIIAFKDNSIYVINNVYGNLAALQLDELTNRFGLVAPESIAHVGKDLWFLSELGVMSIRQTELNQIQGVALPVSDPIQPLIDRINWKYASKAQAAYWENKYLLAVPLDDAERFGRELLKDQATYHIVTGNITISGLVDGATYRWIKGANDNSISDGTTTLTNSGDITISGTTLTANGFIEFEADSSLKRVYKGVNNVVLVYDVLNQSWSGYDESDDMMVQEWVQTTVNGRRRLLFASNDGFVKMYEEGFQDQLPEPYVKITVVSIPTAGNTIQINNGDLITAANLATNTASNWGVGLSGGNLVIARQNFVAQIIIVTNPSFNYLSLAPWSTPNCQSWIEDASNGVFRFYSTNGLIPTVSVSGSWYTIASTSTRPITSSCTTRYYQNQSRDVQEFSWASLDIQTWSPNYDIDVLYTGVLEEISKASSKTKDRRKWYRPFDKSDFELSNTSGRYNEKYREDYSLLLGSGNVTGEAASVRLDTTTGGIRLDLHQEARETFKLSNSAPGMRVKITNSEGRFRILAVKVESTADQTRGKTRA